MIDIPDSAAPLVRRFEGLHRVVTIKPIVLVGPYLCPAGYPTIGYGHVVSSMDHPAITEEEAEQLLSADLLKFAEAVLRLCPRLWLEPGDRLAAIISFAFNLGAGRLQTSTLRRRINEGDWMGAAAELRRWVYGGGRKLAGLVARREAEARLLINPA